jgi:hypothetical protein
MNPRQEIIDLLTFDLGDSAKEESSIAKAIYKGTACGAWLEIPDPDTIRIGSIVENGDQEIGPYSLTWPFTREEFWNTVEQVDDEACEIFNMNEQHNWLFKNYVGDEDR